MCGCMCVWGGGDDVSEGSENSATSAFPVYAQTLLQEGRGSGVLSNICFVSALHFENSNQIAEDLLVHVHVFARRTCK